MAQPHLAKQSPARRAPPGSGVSRHTFAGQSRLPQQPSLTVFLADEAVFAHADTHAATKGPRTCLHVYTRLTALHP